MTNDRDNEALIAFVRALALTIVNLGKPTAARFIDDLDLTTATAVSEMEEQGVDVKEGVNALRKNLALALQSAVRASDKTRANRTLN